MTEHKQRFDLLVQIRYYLACHGFCKTMARAFVEFWRISVRREMLVYYCDLEDETSFSARSVPGLTFTAIASEQEVPADYWESFSKHRSPILVQRETLERMRLGATLWVARVAGQLAGFGWSLAGKTQEPYFFPLRKNDVHFFSFFVFPDFRGKGINRALVSTMLNSLTGGKYGRAYIETNIWNRAEQASLRKTPFVKLGTVRKFGMFGRAFVRWSGGEPAALRAAEGMGAALRAVATERHDSQSHAEEPGQRSDAVTLTLATSFENIQHLRDEWDRLVMESGGDIYMSFDWCAVWWKYYGAQRRLQILLFHCGGRLAGIVPMFTETVWLGLSWLKVAKIVGSDFGLQVCSLLVVPEFLDAVQTGAIEYFCEKCGCDAVLLAPLSQTKRSTKEMRCWSASRRHAAFRVVEGHGEKLSVFCLPETFEDYLKRIGKSQRGNYKRDCNLLTKSFRFTSDVVKAEASVEKDFASFAAMHQTQWQAEGMMGHFTDWPHALEFNAELTRMMAAKGRVRFYRLLVDGKPVSYQYCFLFNQCLHWRLCARLHDEQWKRYGLGRMGLLKMIEAAIAEGVREIEAGRGHYGYKASSGASETPMLSLAFLRKRLGSTVRYHTFLVCRRVLHFVYYKIIFHRVYPRLRFLRRPLARIWIRAQF